MSVSVASACPTGRGINSTKITRDQIMSVPMASAWLSAVPAKTTIDTPLKCGVFRAFYIAASMFAKGTVVKPSARSV